MFDSEEKLDLIETVRNTLNNSTATTDPKVKARQCKNDKNDIGIELTLFGDSISLRPVIEDIEQLEDWAIETIFYSVADEYFHCPNCDERVRETGISLFCAYKPEKGLKQQSISGERH